MDKEGKILERHITPSENRIKTAFSYAFPLTVPIGLSFLFLGGSYGLYAVSQGFPMIMPALTAIIIFAGSMEFVTVSLLLGPFDPLGAFLLTLMVNARHLFYGIAMLSKYSSMGWKKYPLIGGMCDGSFAINVSAKVPEHVDKGWFYLWVSLLDYLYWVFGSFVGGVAGRYATFINLKGIEFMLVSLFAVIFLETILSAKNRNISKFGAIGIIISLGALILFGPAAFIVPAMIGMFLACLALRWWGGISFD